MRERFLAAVDGFGGLVSTRFCDACLALLWLMIVSTMVALAVMS